MKLEGKPLNQRFQTFLKCVSLLLLTVLSWHIYRFVAEVSPAFPYLRWGTPLEYVFYFGFYVLIFATVVLFVMVIDRSSLRVTGLRKVPRWHTYVILGILFAFSARFLEILPLSLAGGNLALGAYPSPPVMLFWIADTLVVGLAEEGAFRGYIQRNLTQSYGFIPALLLTVVLFKIYHVDFFRVTVPDLPTLILPLPTFGMFAGYFYYRTRENLLGPIALHMFYDLFGTIVPLEAGISNLPAVPFLRTLQWFALILALKLLADRGYLSPSPGLQG